MEQTPVFKTEDVESTKGLAWLSYIGFLFLIPMLVNKDSPYTKFHVNQGIVLFLAEIIINVAGIVLGIALRFLPFVGGIIANLLQLALGLVCLVLVILGIVNAVQGNANRLPVIGNIELYK